MGDCIEEYPKVGDIILIRDSSLQSRVLCILQSILLMKRIYYSHVLITLAVNEYLHSTLDEGVKIIRFSDFYSSNYSSNKVLVIRNEKFSTFSINKQLELLMSFAHKTYFNPYNHFFGIPKKLTGKNSWFCSELAAKCFENFNIYKKRPPEKIWPGHFQLLTKRKGWFDVTNYYREYWSKSEAGSSDECTDPHARSQYIIDEGSFKLQEQYYSIIFLAEKYIGDFNEFKKVVEMISKRITKLTNEKLKK